MDFAASLGLDGGGILSLGSWMDVSSGAAADVAVGGWLAIAFTLGLVHALDADHVAAVSVLATRRGGRRAGVRAGLRWAVGHGLVLMAVGLGLLTLGRALPLALVIGAERAVGLVMVGLGIYVWLSLARQRSHLHFHAHDGLLPHAHWHTHEADREEGREASGHQHDHGAVMLGALHGLAGSAPILAVLPAAARSPGLGLAYLLLFAVGVALAMALVSGLLGHLAERLSQQAQSAGLSVMRGLSATASIALGAWIALATG